MAETDDEIIVKILEQDNLVADHAMNEAILDYDRSIQRLNMLLVVSGVMLTIGANLILRDLERHIFILTAIFLCTTLISSAVCILGLFMKRDLKGLLNPNSDSLRKAKDLASFYNSSIDSKISDREIREGNSLQNLYRGGEFDE
ncbi:MAG: hypothetical protein E7Z65_01775 [Thermoplasmata archaeon]|nr:hypothetical protein [Thermoplasmata archaeon]